VRAEGRHSHIVARREATRQRIGDPVDTATGSTRSAMGSYLCPGERRRVIKGEIADIYRSLSSATSGHPRSRYITVVQPSPPRRCASLSWQKADVRARPTSCFRRVRLRASPASTGEAADGSHSVCHAHQSKVVIPATVERTRAKVRQPSASVAPSERGCLCQANAVRERISMAMHEPPFGPFAAKDLCDAQRPVLRR